MSDRLIPLGEIVATHGIEGWVKLKAYNPDTALLSPSQGIYLEKGALRAPGLIEASRLHKGQFLLKLQGVDGISEAKKWIGFVLSVDANLLQPPSTGEYYYYQAVGLEVFDLQGRRLGVVTRIWPKAGGDLYVVANESKEYLIPAVKEVIEKVDLPAGRMIINPPPGLLDL